MTGRRVVSGPCLLIASWGARGSSTPAWAKEFLHGASRGRGNTGASAGCVTTPLGRLVAEPGFEPGTSGL